MLKSGARDEDAIWETSDRWLLEPQTPAQAPDKDTTDLAFLYCWYGFLTVEPITQLDNLLQLTKPSAQRITGLKADGLDEGLEHINAFITSVLQGQLPDGHCDLTPTSPDNEQFLLSSWGVLDWASQANVPDFGDDLFVYTPHDNCNRILIYDPLTLIEMARMKVQTNRVLVIDYLLCNGSWFTLLSGETECMDTSNIHILTFPIHPEGWVATVEDYQVYMSRLKAFLTQCPNVAVTTLTQGGIAWQLAREALGLNIDLVLSNTVFDEQCFAVNVVDFPQ